jgi:hypothetical protein
MIRAYINATTKAVTRAVIPVNFNICPEYRSVLETMPTLPSLPDKINQNQLLKDLVDLGVYTKAEFIDIFATPSSDASLINWANPGTFTPALVSTPAFEAYAGYTGASTGNKCVRLNFNPAVDAIKTTKDNFTAIVGVCNDVDETFRDFGASDGTTHILIRSKLTNQSLMYANDTNVQYVTNKNGKAHYAIGRATSASKIESINDFYNNPLSASSAATLNYELHAAGRKINGVAEASNRQIAYVMYFSALTKYEINKVIVAAETYLRKYGNGLISVPFVYDVPSTKLEMVLPSLGVEDGIAVHPSVVNIGYQWNGYQYWMANTPLPQTSEYPHIYASNDGINWVVPTGLTNPIIPVVGGTTFAPDPELYFENNTLYCFFKYNPLGVSTNVSYVKSTDGITWTERVDTNIDGSNSRSQTIVKNGANYYMYEQVGDTAVIRRHTSTSIEGSWGNTVNITINGRISPTAQHIHVIKIGDYFYITQGADQFINIAHSLDGLTFENNINLIFRTESWEKGFYRPSMMVDVNNNVYLYYSHNFSTTGPTDYKTARVKLEILTP